MKISIFGKPGCDNCAEARAVLAGADYLHHTELFDIYGNERALEIIEACGGSLPIIIITTVGGELLLSRFAGNARDCDGGECRIGGEAL